MVKIHSKKSSERNYSSASDASSPRGSESSASSASSDELEPPRQKRRSEATAESARPHAPAGKRARASVPELLPKHEAAIGQFLAAIAHGGINTVTAARLLTETQELWADNFYRRNTELDAPPYEEQGKVDPAQYERAHKELKAIAVQMSRKMRLSACEEACVRVVVSIPLTLARAPFAYVKDDYRADLAATARKHAAPNHPMSDHLAQALAAEINASHEPEKNVLWQFAVHNVDPEIFPTLLLEVLAGQNVTWLKAHREEVFDHLFRVTIPHYSPVSLPDNVAIYLGSALVDMLNEERSPEKQAVLRSKLLAVLFAGRGRLTHNSDHFYTRTPAQVKVFKKLVETPEALAKFVAARPLDSDETVPRFLLYLHNNMGSESAEVSAVMNELRSRL